jgi:two-component system sensor histidine kinase NreB
MDVRIDADAAIDVRLGFDKRLVLYRIVQEAVSNALRHGGTSVVRVELGTEGDRVVASISDEGRGFSAEHRAGAGLGLLGMQERAAMVGGRLSIESQQGKGTMVRVEIPMDQERS